MGKEKYLELKKATAFNKGIAFYSELSPNEVTVVFREGEQDAYERTDINRAYYKYINPDNELVDRFFTMMMVTLVIIAVTIMLWTNLIKNIPLLVAVVIAEVILIVVIEQLYYLRPGVKDNLKRYKIAGGIVSIAYNKYHRIPTVLEAKEFLKLFKPKKETGLMYVEPRDEEIELAIFGIKMWYDQERRIEKKQSYRI